MNKTLAVAGAVAAIGGMSLMGTPASAASNTAPKHLVKVAAPSAALVKSKTCASPQNSGYHVIVKVDHAVVSGKVDINQVYTQYEHRVAGLWGVSDWSSDATDTIKNAGNTWGSYRRNPGAKNSWYPASPAFTPNNLQVVVNAVGGGKTVTCTVTLP